MKIVIVRFVTATLAATQAIAALAQSEEEDLAQVYGDKTTVSIATGSPQTLSRAPSVASVITAEDMASMGAKDLDEVLETVPGVHVSKTADRYFSIYQFRGISGNPINPQVLVMQNGIPMNTLNRGDRGETWASQSLENIARIEVIRGPGSALYGADAYSGVINIITKTAADMPGTRLGAGGGSFNTWNTWAQHGGKWGAVDVAAYVHVGSTDGIKEVVTVDAQTARDKIFGTYASLAPGQINTGYDATDANLDLGYGKWKLRTGYRLRDQLGSGSGVSSTLDPVGTNRGERINADLSWTDPQFAKNWGLGLTASFLYFGEMDYLQLSPPGTRFPTGSFPNGMIGNPERYERQMRLSGFATYTGFNNHSLRFGLGHEDLNMYETATHKNYFLNSAGVPVPTAFMDYSTIQTHLPPHLRRVDYFNAQDEWNFAKDWTLTAGVRHDRYSDFGNTTNPRLALVWDATLDFTAKLLWGQAFRAPSFIEQYGINPVANGNASLKPETIGTIEAAFSWQAYKDIQVNLSLFHFDMKDVIRTVPNATPGTGSTFQNTGKQHGNGVELETVWDATYAVRLTGNYSYQKSIDETSNKDAGYAPHHHVYARADWRFYEPWQLSSQVNWVGERKRATGDNRNQIPDYTTVDLTVHSSSSKSKWDLSASVRNLFDATVLEPSLAPGTAIPNDLPMAPRSFYLQAVYKF